MADSAVVVTSGTGTNIDSRTESTNGHHRQVVVLGDPSTNAGVAPVDATAGLKVDLGADNDITGTVTANAGTNLNTSALALEAGNLASIKAKTDNIPALGQALAAASTPVVLTAAQITTLTPPAAITGFATSANQLPDGHNVTVDNASLAVTGTFWQATQPVSLASAPTTTVTATDLDIRPLVNTDVVTAELSAVDNAVLDTIAAKDFATQTTLAAINSKLVTGTDIGDVTINNASGASAVNIQDGGNSITIDGAVTNTVLSVVGNGAAATAQRVTLANDSTGIVALTTSTASIGKLAANSGVDIGDVDVTSVPRSLSGPGQPGTAIDSYTQAAISAVTGTDQSLIAAPGANKQIWVYGIGFTCSVAGTVAIQDEDNTAITGVVSYAQYSGPLVSPSGNFSMPLWKVATNKALEADVTTATINGWINYAIISV